MNPSSVGSRFPLSSDERDEPTEFAGMRNPAGIFDHTLPSAHGQFFNQASPPLGRKVRRLDAKPDREGGEHRLVPDVLAHVEQEAGVRDDTSCRRGLEALGQKCLQINLGLVGLSY